MESANLTLRTVDGVVNDTARQSSFTWAIDLRTLLGDMYNRYDRFNLILDGVSTLLVASDFGNTANDTMLNIIVSGLPFINQTYDTTKNLNTTRAILAPVRFIRNSVAIYDYSGNYYLTFGKSQEVCYITISLTRMDNNPFSSPSPLPHCNYYFHIVGIPNSDNKQLTPPERMDNNRGFLK